MGACRDCFYEKVYCKYPGPAAERIKDFLGEAYGAVASKKTKVPSGLKEALKVLFR